MSIVEDLPFPDGLPRASAAPEEHTVFRLAQLTILLGEIAPSDQRPVDLERVGYYDFFAANPFAIVQEGDAVERARLHRAAFDERQLTYASTGTRFANRRRRLQHDLALLVAYGLAQPQGSGYVQTAAGAELVGSLSALYVDQYKESTRIVHGRLRRLSDAQLAESARRWLKEPSLILDLYGSTEEPLQSDGNDQTWESAHD